MVVADGVLQVPVTASWPTTVSKVAGRYLRALTMKRSDIGGEDNGRLRQGRVEL